MASWECSFSFKYPACNGLNFSKELDRKSRRSPSNSDKRDQTRSDMSKSDRIRKSSSTSSSNKEHSTKPKVSTYSHDKKGTYPQQRGKTFPFFQPSFQRISGTNDTSFVSPNIGRLEFAKNWPWHHFETGYAPFTEKALLLLELVWSLS